MKHTYPKHDKQSCALSDIKYLMDAAYAIHRGTDGDGMWTIYDYEHLGFDCHKDKWTEKSEHPNTKALLDTFNWLLYDHSEYGGASWAEHCGPLKKAFRDIIREAKKRITETDWTPCRCKACTERRKKAKRD